MAHAQKPDFVFWRNGGVHLHRQERQFSRLLAAEVCASAVVMLDTPCSEVVWSVLATHSIRQFPVTSPPVRHRVPSHFNWTLLKDVFRIYTYYKSSPSHAFRFHHRHIIWKNTSLCNVPSSPLLTYSCYLSNFF